MTTQKKTPKKLTRKEAEMGLAYDVVKKYGLPRGEVVKILKEKGVNSKVIDELSTRLVPYGHTPVQPGDN
ncbi:MAG: hypothetical protein P0Y58_22325 [Candidatus Pseudomonas phytovorans]|uniref:DUF3606 domain-containing protein n=1 Tax=Candidatus Pseudomonas phytovorans TaxID=3121377 RepID=A0AAJ5WFP6_9PSED|nr:hypothetical protein [Pseudomonas sp.]WEK29603.1 MAG: hypothetical protein P0Y58_22325 [Pseudomonas sp.]